MPSLIDQIKDCYRPRPGTAILGAAVQSKDRGAEWITQPNYYDWYFAVGELTGAKIIGEIGVRFGYSLLSMAKGAGRDCRLFGWDNESYEPGCLAIALMNLQGYMPHLLRCDTLKMESLGLDLDNEFDLFHVDGDHTYGGAIHDCHLAWNALKPGGILIVDDMLHTESSRDGVRFFAESKGLPCEVIPTYGGLAVFEKPCPS